MLTPTWKLKNLKKTKTIKDKIYFPSRNIRQTNESIDFNPNHMLKKTKMKSFSVMGQSNKETKDNKSSLEFFSLTKEPKVFQ